MCAALMVCKDHFSHHEFQACPSTRVSHPLCLIPPLFLSLLGVPLVVAVALAGVPLQVVLVAEVEDLEAEVVAT